MKTVIISDTHLKFYENDEDIQRRQNVLAFLETLKHKTDLLIINGDFFDLWIAWKHVIIREYFSILIMLYELVKSGTRIVMLPGNHDFWFNSFLQKSLGIEICQSSFISEIEGKSFFIDHGDRYTRNDLRYHIYRFFIRNRLIQSISAAFHPDFSLGIGIKLSRSSRKRRIPHKKREMLIMGLRTAAENLITKNNYDYVIFGHSHIPTLEKCTNGIYANSGDWISHSTYLVFEHGELTINEYKIEGVLHE
ncbi:MAG: UDP-2,3-diacylglucosamine diphosphatase [Candidatus Cloacimonetes bacterium]|nr:UDP-2,3-diacylglucosamine diphosphatase [Candidatus Cloacimonadota bacterium]